MVLDLVSHTMCGEVRKTACLLAPIRQPPSFVTITKRLSCIHASYGCYDCLNPVAMNVLPLELIYPVLVSGFQIAQFAGTVLGHRIPQSFNHSV